MGRNSKVFGFKVRKRREELDITQGEVGERMGRFNPEMRMSDENIGRIERHEIAGIMTKNVPALAHALDVPHDVFRREYIVIAEGSSKSTDAKATESPSADDHVRIPIAQAKTQLEKAESQGMDYVLFPISRSHRRREAAKPQQKPKGGRP